MLKMYEIQNHAGNTQDFWEENWAGVEFKRSVLFCAIDPLRPLFEKYLRPDSLMLEGGCGMGNYVTYYSARGYHVVGLDFAENTLKTLMSRQSGLTLSAGDVSCLPFADKTFDLYYSGGVVEHFEGGAKDSLIEARRVLKDDGVLLMSVPYYSPLRQALAPFKKNEWRRVGDSAVDKTPPIEGKKFFQYAYSVREFESMLADAGLRTIERQGYAVVWGLYELPFIRGTRGELAEKGNLDPQDEAGQFRDADIIAEPSNSIVKRLVVSEDDSIPVLGLGVKMMRWAASNMMMYVCVRA